METKILTTADEDLKIAARLIKEGGNVIFPTETVYGLGADAFNPDAVKNIFKAKGRPADNPLIVHISDTEMLSEIAAEIPESAERLMKKYWPGALTIIFKKCKNVPYETTGGLDTVAVRMPSSGAAAKIIEYAGTPIAAPSANLSGKPSPTTAEHCIKDMKGRVDAIVAGEDCSVGVESTVLDLSGVKPILLRPGGITLEQIKEELGEVETATSLKEGERPKSPGLKYKHYAPNAEVVILSGGFDEVKAYIQKSAEDKKVGVLVFDEFPKIEGAAAMSLGDINNPKEAAHNLFAALRKMDDMGVDVIYAPEIPQNGVWLAVRNRLYRSAGDRIIYVSGQKPKSFLFVCTGNTCRSPMAEAIFNKIASDSGAALYASSAGIFADGSEVSPNAAAALAELGINIDGRKSVQADKSMIDRADVVLTMTESHKNLLTLTFGNSGKIYTLYEYANESGDVADPFGGTIYEYRKCRDEIMRLTEKIIKGTIKYDQI